MSVRRGGRWYAGVDVGGTKTALVVARGGRSRPPVVLPTPRVPPRRALGQIADRLRDELARAGGRRFDGIGLGVPGVCDPARGTVVWAPNLPGWRAVPAGRWLAARFGCPVAVENDADMAALGEAARGAGRGCRDFVTLTVGTGIGGGLVLNGALVRGAGGVAGAAGWLRAGRRRLEDAASGRALPRVGPAAAARALGGAVADLVSLLNPEKVILGGGVMEGPGRAWLPAIRRTVRRRAQPVAARQVLIVASSLGNRAGLWGALAAARGRARR